MRKVILVLLLLCISAESQAAWPWGKDTTLVTINDQVYTTDDFRRWWSSWQDKEMDFSDSLEDFIDWELLANEAEVMELDREPRLIGKLKTFLKVRKFMLLKNEEIDARIKISEEDLRTRYAEMYSPLWKGRLLFFEDEQAAIVAYEDVVSKVRTEEQLVELPVAEGGPSYNKTVMLRPENVPGEWLKTLTAMTDGQVGGPLEYGVGQFGLFFLHEKAMPGDEDFDLYKQKIRADIQKEKESELTRKLIRRLREKFGIKVDADLLAGLDYLSKPAEELLAKPLITANNNEVFSVEYVWNKIGLNMRSVKESEIEAKKESVKFLTVEDIISREVLNWEAMERPYEEEEPLKWAYQFYYRNRLNIEIAQLLFDQPFTVTDDMVEKYYQENIDQFARPDILSYAYIPGSDEVINRLWEEIKKGADFFELGQQHYRHKVPEKTLAADKVEKVIKAELDKLFEGEVSPPFALNDETTEIVKLLKREVSPPQPLSEVRVRVVEDIKTQAFERKRSEYLKLMKSKSVIVVNSENWQRLKDEFEVEDDK